MDNVWFPIPFNVLLLTYLLIIQKTCKNWNVSVPLQLCICMYKNFNSGNSPLRPVNLQKRSFVDKNMHQYTVNKLCERVHHFPINKFHAQG
jgi:hypothetical protein